MIYSPIIIITGMQVCPKRSHAGLHLLSGPKMGFSLRKGDTHCPDKREIWHGERATRAKFHVYLGRNVRIHCSPKTVKISIFGHKFAPQGDSFAQFLQNFYRLYTHLVGRF